MADIYSQLVDAIKKAAALRIRLKLQPAGGEGDKVFPATHEDGAYAYEQRRIDGEIKQCVLLSSVQAEANQHEMALLQHDEAQIPRLEVEIPGTGVITSLDAPHRAYDAIFRDCEHEGKAFYESAIGKALVGASEREPAALFRWCPNSLLWGAWDSRNVGIASFRSARIPRMMTSEIIGVGSVDGVKTASRLDPIGLPKSVGMDIYRSPDQREWGFEPVKGWTKTTSITEVGHSNITPSISTGGVSMEYALQTTVISLGQLRRLGLPDDHSRLALAAAGLLAFKRRYERGYRLRSRCDLVAAEKPLLETVGQEGTALPIADIDPAAIMRQALEQSSLKFEGTVRLQPSERLLKLVGLAEGAPA